MRFLTLIGTSVGASAVAAAAFAAYVEGHTDAPGFWQHNPAAAAWTAAGGPGGLALALFAVLAFLLVTGAALRDLGTARRRVAAAARRDGNGLLERSWAGVFAGTDFAAIAGQFTEWELGIAPLSLLRIVRAELWRIYAKRLVAAGTVTVALAAIVLALRPYLAVAPPNALGADVRLAPLAAFALLAAAAATWLLIDDAISRLAMTLTRQSSASWDASLTIGTPRLADAPGRALAPAAPPAGAPAIDTLAAAVDRLVATLAASSAAAPEPEPATAEALARVEILLRQSAGQQRELVDDLCRAMGRHMEGLAQSVERARTPGESETGVLSEALAQLAAAVDKLADPVLQRIKLLAATDRRLLSVLQRQEAVVGTVGNRWSELVTALQAMSAGLESFAQAAARQDRLLPSAPLLQPGDLHDELQDLLDEMAELDEPDGAGKAKPAAL